MLEERVRAAALRLTRAGYTTEDHRSAQQQALDIVRGIVPFDIGSFATVDPATVLWTSCVLHGIDEDPRREAFMFDNEYHQNDLLKIAEIARQPVPVARLSEIDPDILHRSPRYQVISSYGAVDELRCAIVDQGNCWASFEIYRGAASGKFTEKDARNAALLVRSLSRLVRTSLLKQAASISPHSSDAPGVLVLSRDGTVLAESPSARKWLSDIGTNSSIPPAIRSLAMRVVADDAEAMSIVLPRISGGWIRVQAVLLVTDGEQHVNVLLEPARPPILPETVSRVYELTSRESEVVMWIARGLSSKEIGIQLGISAYTVNDHIKAAFQKVGVQSRQQLVATLFFDHCLPMRQRDAIPGPYGWFLSD